MKNLIRKMGCLKSQQFQSSKILIFFRVIYVFMYLSIYACGNMCVYVYEIQIQCFQVPFHCPTGQKLWAALSLFL